jgi:hypothetical protein
MDRDHDLSCLRMFERVAQRLACDAERFVANDGFQIARLAVDIYGPRALDGSPER